MTETVPFVDDFKMVCREKNDLAGYINNIPKSNQITCV